MMTDLTIRQNIQNAMQFEPSLDAAHIGVAVDKGIVTLSGHVNSYAEKLMAERIVKRMVGVKGLAQDLEVEYATDKKTADDQIAKRAINILEWDTTIPTGFGHGQSREGLCYADRQCVMELPESCGTEGR